MKSFKFIIIGIILAIISFFALMFIQMRESVTLEKTREEKQKVIMEASAAKKKLAKMERDLNELKEASQFVKKMILPDDAAVLSFMRDISICVGNNALKKLEFAYSPNFKPPAGVLVNSDLGRAYGLKNSKASFIAMNFEGDYVSFGNFMKDLYSFKTVVSVENISIKRDSAIMPRQKIFLVIAVYMY